MPLNFVEKLWGEQGRWGKKTGKKKKKNPHKKPPTPKKKKTKTSINKARGNRK